MFELLGGIAGVVFGSWHELVRISEWTGVSAGALIGLIALAWFVEPVRWLAIAGAVAIGAGYGGLIHGNHAGRADYKAKIEREIANAVLAGDAARERALRDFDAAPDQLRDDGFERQ